MLEQMLANRRIEKNQCNIKNAKTELKSAVGINFWDRNLGLESNAEIALYFTPEMAHKKQTDCAKEKWAKKMDSDMAMPQVLHTPP